MISYFGNKLASDIFHEGKCKKLPEKHWVRATYLLDVMEAIDALDDLKRKGHPPSVRLHRLKHERKHEYAIDIHKTGGWRITFQFHKGHFADVKIENYHQ